MVLKKFLQGKAGIETNKDATSDSDSPFEGCQKGTHVNGHKMCSMSCLVAKLIKFCSTSIKKYQNSLKET